ncbi:MAG: hypothetical protein WAW37_16375 [Syntrophobacteraceae bacterium]
MKKFNSSGLVVLIIVFGIAGFISRESPLPGVALIAFMVVGFLYAIYGKLSNIAESIDKITKVLNKTDA